MISSHSLRKTAGLRAWQLLLLFGFLIFTELGTVSANDTEEECENPSKLRLVTLEKLAAYVTLCLPFRRRPFFTCQIWTFMNVLFLAFSQEIGNGRIRCLDFYCRRSV
jgi:hypothetical protein